MSQGSLNPKIRFLGQKVWPVACAQTDRQTDTQTHRQTDRQTEWLLRAPFQGFRIFSFNLSSRIGPIDLFINCLPSIWIVFTLTSFPAVILWSGMQGIILQNVSQKIPLYIKSNSNRFISLKKCCFRYSIFHFCWSLRKTSQLWPIQWTFTWSLVINVTERLYRYMTVVMSVKMRCDIRI